MIGDKVQNNAGDVGIVTDLYRDSKDPSHEMLTIKWDDGVVEIAGYLAGEHILISRA